MRRRGRTLERASRVYRDRVAFIGVNVQDTDASAREFLRRFGVTYPNGRDPGGAISVDYGMSGVPESYFVDRDGQIVRKWQGPLDDQRLRAFLDELLTLSADPIVTVGLAAGLRGRCCSPSSRRASSRSCPGYLSLVSGVAIGAEPVSRRQTERVVIASVLFVLGFTVVFVALGAAAGLLGGLLEGGTTDLHAHRRSD